MVIVTKFHQNRSNGSWDMLCWQKEEEEEEERKNARETGHIRLQRMCKNARETGHIRLQRMCKKERKKEETSKKQDPAGVTGRVTRHVAVTDGVPCRLWDIYPWLTPVSLFSRKCDASVWITWIYLVT